MKRKQKGFSLIELLIVVAIILIIAAIAIPNLIRAKMQANEASAVATLRTINTAEVVYSTTYSIPSVFGTLAQLGSAGTQANCAPGSSTIGSAQACLIDYDLEKTASSTSGKAGYQLAVVPTATGGYTANNNPVVPGSSGIRYFYSDQTLVIRQNSTTPAGSGDSAI